MVTVVPGTMGFRFNDIFTGVSARSSAGAQRMGFNVQFDANRARADLRETIQGDAVAVVGASVDAVTQTTREVKEMIRSYIDAHFQGSEFIGGAGGRKSRRRAAFAAAQNKFYNDIEAKGQFTGLIYSKLGRGRGPGGFVDYLLLHMRGGIVKPRDGDWIKIPNEGASGLIGGQVGEYPQSDSRIFFRPSRDRKKLFLLRAFGSGASPARRGSVELLATLVKQLDYPARMTGIETIAGKRVSIFYGHFDAALAQRGIA